MKRARKVNSRGYFGIGVYRPKTETNIGTLWRSAFIYGASFIFTIERRYRKQRSDVLLTYRHIPLFHYNDFDDFNAHVPVLKGDNCPIVCVENCEDAKPLNEYKHPQQAIYLLGSEDSGLPKDILRARPKVIIQSPEVYCLNVATAGSIIMYDRFIKGMK